MQGCVSVPCTNLCLCVCVSWERNQSHSMWLLFLHLSILILLYSIYTDIQVHTKVGTDLQAVTLIIKHIYASFTLYTLPYNILAQHPI